MRFFVAKRSVTVFVILVAGSLFVTALGQPSGAERPQVLVLSSYHQGLEGADKNLAGIKDTFEKQQLNVRLFVESLESKRFSSESHLKNFEHFLRRKYAKTSFDLLIPCNDKAVDFILKRRDSLFSNVPVVFCGVNHYKPQRFEDYPDVTGVLERLPVKKNVRSFLDLHPDTEKLYIVNDHTPTGRLIRKRVQKEIRAFEDRIDYKFLTDYTMSELKEKLHNLPPGSIVWLLSFNRDRKGNTYSYESAVHHVTTATTRPVYGSWRFYLNRGIVGGWLVSSRAQGEQAAEMGGKVLRGTSPSDIPIREDAKIQPVFDYFQLLRFDISTSDLPAGAELINGPDQDSSRGPPWGMFFVLVGIIAETLLIGFLVRNIVQRNKTKKQLRESEERHRSLIRHLPLGIYRNTPGPYGKFLMVNSAMSELFGYDEEELCNLYVSELYANPEERKDFSDTLLNTGEVTGKELKLKRKDGSEIWGLLNAHVVYGSNGGAAYFDGTVQDITERKKAEYALQQSEEKFSLAFHGIPESITVLACDDLEQRRFLDVNKGFQELTGYSWEEAVGKTPLELGLWPDMDQYKTFEKFLSDNGSVRNLQCSMRRKDGSLVTALYSGEIVSMYNRTYLVVVTVDITERRRNEDEVIRLRNLLRNIVDSMPSVVVGVDMDGRVTQWNHAAENRTGVLRTNAFGRAIEELDESLASFRSELRHVLQEGELCEKREVERTVNGETQYEDITIYPLWIHSVEGAVIRVDDVTERAKMQAMMVQTEKMMSVGGLAAGMAHEINNPLGTIMQGSQNILRRLSPDDESNREAAEKLDISIETVNRYIEERQIDKLLDDIRSDSMRAADLVENMLDFSRPGHAAKEYCNVNELLEGTIALIAKDYGLKKYYDFENIDIRREFDQDNPEIYAAPNELEQVFLNLLKNAVQALAEGTVNGELARITMRTKGNGESLRVEIEDNGPGMDEPTKWRVFDPFFTTKPAGTGTGLGLSVSHTIVVDNHCGNFEITSESGKGTTFSILLPAYVEQEVNGAQVSGLKNE